MDNLQSCLDSVMAQSLKAHVIVVDNGSVDGSADFIEANYPTIELIRHDKNRGYAGGVNPGFRRAQEMGAAYDAPFNNDAIADKDWLRLLVQYLDDKGDVGIATCKLLNGGQTYLDSTGDYYTTWGLPYPRGRGETDLDKYDDQTEIFGASGGASLYRVAMLDGIGLLDEDFFAYYEDVDLSWRAQLAGWKVAYVPQSRAYHQIGQTSGKIKGFTTYQTIKNLPLLFWKNVPSRLLPIIWWRFVLAYTAFVLSALARGQIVPTVKGWARMNMLLPKKLTERRRIQRQRKVSIDYIRSLLVWDLPPNAYKLRRLRSVWWRLRGGRSAA